MSVIDQYQLTHVAHYATDGVRCTVFGTPQSDNTVCMVFDRTLPHGDDKLTPLLRLIFQWYCDAGVDKSYPVLRSTMAVVQCTPNGGSLRGKSEYEEWCDDQIGALVRHYAMRNGSRRIQ